MILVGYNKIAELNQTMLLNIRLLELINFYTKQSILNLETESYKILESYDRVYKNLSDEKDRFYIREYRRVNSKLEELKAKVETNNRLIENLNIRLCLYGCFN
jgi:hypothetical protein